MARTTHAIVFEEYTVQLARRSTIALPYHTAAGNSFGFLMPPPLLSHLATDRLPAHVVHLASRMRPRSPTDESMIRLALTAAALAALVMAIAPTTVPMATATAPS